MAAVTRWVQYDVSAAGVPATGGTTIGGVGQRGFYYATAPVGDSFNIGTTNNRLWIKIDGLPPSPIGLTLASGVELDPRFVAKDITEAMHNAGQATAGWDQAQCLWEGNEFKLYSGTIGINSNITVWSGENTAHLELGWGTHTEGGGTVKNSTGNNNGNLNNKVTASGSYNGLFDETYTIVINTEVSINTPAKQSGNTFTGAITTGGFDNWNTIAVYSIAIDTINGTTMGAGTGNVPKISWTIGDNNDNGGPIELLYTDYWYKIGTRGLMVKFSEGIFSTADPAWTITCNLVDSAQGGNPTAPAGTARFIWSSNRGDDAGEDYQTEENGFVRLGSRGVYVKWTTAANLSAGDEWTVLCSPPQPTSYNITNLNYGNVTVSTESPVRNVIFEILSGAVEIDTVKFGLQSHGNFEHHGESNGDTYFRFGTVGPGNNGGVPDLDGFEWWTNVTAADISDDNEPSYLHATKENLSVVADADSSESIGTSTFAGMVADPIWLNIKLGQSEVGANSTINYRVYFDYA